MKNKSLNFLLILFLFIASCTSTKENTSIASSTNSDTNYLQNYNLLKEFAVCKCVYYSLDNSNIVQDDISPSVYANLLSYAGIDTISSLAKEKAKAILPMKYIDYQGKKAFFFECNKWVNTQKMDSLFKNYSHFSATDTK